MTWPSLVKLRFRCDQFGRSCLCLELTERPILLDEI
jgi:hypothetical protein